MREETRRYTFTDTECLRKFKVIAHAARTKEVSVEGTAVLVTAMVDILLVLDTLSDEEFLSTLKRI